MVFGRSRAATDLYSAESGEATIDWQDYPSHERRAAESSQRAPPNRSSATLKRPIGV
jgi:hypothetical protein